MGFLTFAAAGGGLILMGAYEAISTSIQIPDQDSTPSSPPSSQSSNTRTQTSIQSRTSSIYYLAASVISLLFVLNSLVSLFDANIAVTGKTALISSDGNLASTLLTLPGRRRSPGLEPLSHFSSICYLALLVILVVECTQLLVRKLEAGVMFQAISPLAPKGINLIIRASLLLDSEDDDVDEEIKEEENLAIQKAGGVELGMNGYGSHR
ncbi:hypothetical protein GBA52_011952 [Prunus armeniaca]|nr:hypothetical protein GBA52_011952 [Prunus armeniaca]